MSINAKTPDSGTSSSLLYEVQLSPITTREMEKDHSIKSVESKGASISHSSGGKIPFVTCNCILLSRLTRILDIRRVSGHLQEDGMHSQPIGKQTRR